MYQQQRKTTMYNIKIWNNENSEPQLRKNIPYGLAYALATKAGFAKAQIICELGIIILETKCK
jgi:hypothetical protein